VIIADLGAAVGCSDVGCDLLQPARATNATTDKNPKPLKHGGKEEEEEICLIFDVIIYESWVL